MAFNHNYNRDCPCDRDCPERSAECHATCERYEAFRKKKDKELQIKQDERNGYNLITHEKKVAIWKKARRSGQPHINPVVGRN